MLAAAREIASGGLLRSLGDSSAGPVRPLDVLYGYSPSLAGNPLMSHRTGFTAETLAEALAGAGFDGSVREDPGCILRASARR